MRQARRRSPTARRSGRWTSAAWIAPPRPSSSAAGSPPPFASRCRRHTRTGASSCAPRTLRSHSTSTRRSTRRWPAAAAAIRSAACWAAAAKAASSRRRTTFSRPAVGRFVTRTAEKVDRRARDADIDWHDGKLVRVRARSGVEVQRPRLTALLQRALVGASQSRTVEGAGEGHRAPRPHVRGLRRALPGRDRGGPRREGAAPLREPASCRTSTRSPSARPASRPLPGATRSARRPSTRPGTCR